jgi:hypothetical protein
MQKQTTRIKKGRDGWEAETLFVADPSKINTKEGTHAWEVHTGKSGKGLRSWAQKGKYKNEDGSAFTSFSFLMFTDPSHNLGTDNTVRCTEKTVTEQHRKALELFMSLENIQP